MLLPSTRRRSGSSCQHTCRRIRSLTWSTFLRPEPEPEGTRRLRIRGVPDSTSRLQIPSPSWHPPRVQIHYSMLIKEQHHTASTRVPHPGTRLLTMLRHPRRSSAGTWLLIVSRPGALSTFNLPISQLMVLLATPHTSSTAGWHASVSLQRHRCLKCNLRRRRSRWLHRCHRRLRRKAFHLLRRLPPFPSRQSLDSRCVFVFFFDNCTVGH